MYSKLINSARFMRALGPFRGLRAFVQLSLADRGIATVASPVGDGVIYARRGSADVEVFDQIFVMRDYDIRRYKHWMRVSKTYETMLASGPRPLILDCGANIGLSSVYLAHLFPDAAIVAVEPELGNFEMLKKNTSSYPRIRALQAAISDHEGYVTIANPAASSWAFRVIEASSEDKSVIPAITVDDARLVAGDHQLSAVKIDIESGEEQLFRSNTGWIEETPLLMIELHDWMLPWAGTSRSFFRALENIEFDFVLAGETALVFNWSCLRETTRFEVMWVIQSAAPFVRTSPEVPSVLLRIRVRVSG